MGRSGATSVLLRVAKSGDLRPAIAAAWCNAAPKKLAREFEASFKLKMEKREEKWLNGRY